MKFFTKNPGCRFDFLSKLLSVMRLAIFFVIMGMMQVSAGTYGQQISLTRKQATFREVFKAIKMQTGYDVLWQPGKFNADQTVSVNYSRKPLQEALRDCLKGTNVVFDIQDQSIVLSPQISIQAPVSAADSIIYKGRVVDEHGNGMAGATVKVTGSRRTTFTNKEGNFSIYGPVRGTLEFSYIGYLGKQLTLAGIKSGTDIQIKMVPGNNSLGEVNIVSTGYQDIPKERATGSFEVITKEQLQHTTDPDLVRRLEGITTSTNFNNNLVTRNSAAASHLIDGQRQASTIALLDIRGRNNLVSPLNSSTSGQVLVVIDGIASPYSIDQINPNDVESIVILKDAAAASIWGSRAANGVLVVKTKQGAYRKPLSVTFNTNFNVTEKQNLFYRTLASTSDYVDLAIWQIKQAGSGFDHGDLQDQPLNQSPIRVILDDQQNGLITNVRANAMIDSLKRNDIRRDYTKYILRDAVTQSYSLSLDGGSEHVAYRLSANYDKSLQNTILNASNRLSLTYNTSIRVNKHLDFTGSVNFARSANSAGENSNPLQTSVNVVYPQYGSLVDKNGQPTTIPYKILPSFLNLLSQAYGDKIMDWSYNPLEDIKEGYVHNILQNLNFNLGARYTINPVFSINVAYNFSLGVTHQDIFDSANSYYVRDLVNQFTDPNTFNHAFPQGAVYKPSTYNSHNGTIRGQFNVNKNWNENNSLSAIAGIDVSGSYTKGIDLVYYGYDPKTLTSNNNLDYNTMQNLLFYNVFGQGQAYLPAPPGLPGFIDSRLRTFSLFSNAAYTYRKKYTVSASIRKDASSDFGYGTNQTGTPFYSFGSTWNVANEGFYNFDLLPRLQLRATFGYNGNVNTLVKPNQQIAYVSGVGGNGLLSATTIPTTYYNPLLRPERSGIANFGVDFGFKNNRISGSLEYFVKNTTGLLSSMNVDPTTGFSNLTLNNASIRGWGTDFTLNTKNLQSGSFGWTSTFLMSYNRNKVTRLLINGPNTASQAIYGAQLFTVGYDVTRLFAFRWAGLDHATGAPMGYYNGQPMVVNSAPDLNKIANQPFSAAHFMGSAVPVYFGSLRNTFTYKSFSLSTNILYKLGYYFRRPVSVIASYYNAVAGGQTLAAEYSDRWQKPGDELKTNVPSLAYPTNQQRDSFYQYADINVLKADHARLQEINLGYTLNKKGWFVKNLRLYANVNNLGIIWRANKLGLDPDVYDYPNPKTYSFGLSGNF